MTWTTSGPMPRKAGKRVLGIDCGTAITGWAILSTDPQDKGRWQSKDGVQLHDFGTIETHKLTPEPQRLLELGQHLQALIAEFKPDEVAIEELFFSKNVTTALKVSQARGVVIYVAAQTGVAPSHYNPMQIKQRITGTGSAKKPQVMFMLRQLFKLPETKLQDDAADAVAIAYTHILATAKA